MNEQHNDYFALKVSASDFKHVRDWVPRTHHIIVLPDDVISACMFRGRRPQHAQSPYSVLIKSPLTFSEDAIIQQPQAAVHCKVATATAGRSQETQTNHLKESLRPKAAIKQP